MAERDSIIAAFPNLVGDIKFNITSPQDPNYNCISWAYGMYKDRWMQSCPTNQIRLDGVVFWWPSEEKKNRNIKYYIEAFQNKGFEICNNYDLEEGYIKIALYKDLITEECVHAARQKTTGVWMSKLGPRHDIEHSTPFSLESNGSIKAYGKVFCCMKCKR